MESLSFLNSISFRIQNISRIPAPRKTTPVLVFAFHYSWSIYRFGDWTVQGCGRPIFIARKKESSMKIKIHFFIFIKGGTICNLQRWKLVVIPVTWLSSWIVEYYPKMIRIARWKAGTENSRIKPMFLFNNNPVFVQDYFQEKQNIIRFEYRQAPKSSDFSPSCKGNSLRNISLPARSNRQSVFLLLMPIDIWQR